ncbi:hypothetical protein, partial [Limnohabitans sp.]|uniref:hypothetical protein n=1 Tax=Limnohabitans sp. TaxID=1907725 RepID=UPI0025B96448
MLLFNTGARLAGIEEDPAPLRPETRASEAAVSEGDDFGVPPPYEEPADTAASPPPRYTSALDRSA